MLHLEGAWKHIPRTVLCFEETEVTRVLSSFPGVSYKHSESSHDFILGLYSVALLIVQEAGAGLLVTTLTCQMFSLKIKISLTSSCFKISISPIS